MINGIIDGFDDRRGDGYLLGDDGRRAYFHCVNIANGLRTVANGARAAGERSVGHLGRDEVIDVTILRTSP